MANDRLYLICRVCRAQQRRPDEYARYLAKYYPSTGYYTCYGAGSNPRPDDYVAKLDRFLDAHHICSLETDGMNWAVGYEADVPYAPPPDAPVPQA